MKVFLTILLLLSQLICPAQSHKRTQKQVAQLQYGGYQSLLVIGDIIWALDNGGTLKSFSSNGEERSISVTLKTPITSIRHAGVDSIILTSNRDIFLLNTKTISYKNAGKLPTNTHLLARDKKGRIWAATEKGLIDIITKNHFVPDSSLNQYYKWMDNPSASLLDSNGVLWIGFGMGEWGGNLQAFDTNTQRFVPIVFRDTLACLNPVKAFSQVKSQIYISGGVMHFTTSGCITRFENFQAKHVFNSSWENNYRTSKYGNKEGEYIGPITYNEAEQSLYYYSQNGVFRARETDDLSKMETWQLVFAPRLRWNGGQRDAIGSPMNMSDMAFTSDNKLVLLTQRDGIGIWDGRVFRLIP